MNELDKLFESMKPMTALFELMDSNEQKKRDAEAEKERQHRIDEGLDDEPEDEEESRTDYAQGMYDSGMKESDFL